MTEKRGDAYANLVTKLGTSKDKSSGSALYRMRDLGSEELDILYEQDSIAARIVDRVVDDSIRSGFSIDSPDKSFDVKSVMSEMEDLEALTACGDAWRWARLYGGSLLFLNVNDGNKMSEPLELDKVTKVNGLHVIESPFVTPSTFDPGLGARAFRNPKHYDIIVPFGRAGVRQIHRSRVVRFDGVRVPPTRMINRGGWGPSVLDRVFRELTQLGEVLGYARNIMHEISVMVLKLEGFRDHVCGTPEEQDQIKKVVEAIRFALDNLHTLALDKKDDYQETSRSVSGLAELLKMFVEALTRTTDYPAMILLNQRAEGSGLANSAGSELSQYYDHVAASRGMKITPALNRILSVSFAARARRGEKVPDEWTISYPPLWQPTEKERSETRRNDAQADQIYTTLQVESSDEVRARLIREGKITELEPERRGDILDLVSQVIETRLADGDFSDEDARMLVAAVQLVSRG